MFKFIVDTEEEKIKVDSIHQRHKIVLRQQNTGKQDKYKLHPSRFKQTMSE